MLRRRSGVRLRRSFDGVLGLQDQIFALSRLFILFCGQQGIGGGRGRGIRPVFSQEEQ